jgi:hypothetical protein
MFCIHCGTENTVSAVYCSKCGKQQGAPITGLPTNVYMWSLALVPLFLGMLDLVLSASISPSASTAVSLMVAVAISIALVLADSKQLMKIGIETNLLLGILLIPAYLYRRARLTSTAQTGLIVWSGAFIGSLLISMLGVSLVGTQVATDATEIAIEDWLVESLITDSSVTVTCPDIVLAKPAATFLCTVDTDPVLTLQVKFENEQGDVTWQLVG